MGLLKKTIRNAKKILINAFGSKIDEFYWKFRHLLGGNWSKSYISQKSIDHLHRKFLVEKIIECRPFKNILEIGCASGPNLYILSAKLPNVDFYGVDISLSAIKEGKEFFKKNNINNVFLKVGKADNLKEFGDKSIDVIFTDAALIYLDNEKIKKAAKEIERVARKAIILFEWHKDGESIYKGHWIHNYKLLFKNAEAIKMPKGIWDSSWEEYGNIIKIIL